MAQPKSTTPGQRPALRLVSTKSMNREDWLKIRKQGIGASDAAAAVASARTVTTGTVDDQDRAGCSVAPDPDDIQPPCTGAPCWSRR